MNEIIFIKYSREEKYFQCDISEKNYYSNPEFIKRHDNRNFTSTRNVYFCFKKRGAEVVAVKFRSIRLNCN